MTIHQNADVQYRICPLCGGTCGLPETEESGHRTLRETCKCEQCGATIVFALIVFACYTEGGEEQQFYAADLTQIGRVVGNVVGKYGKPV